VRHAFQISPGLGERAEASCCLSAGRVSGQAFALQLLGAQGDMELDFLCDATIHEVAPPREEVEKAGNTRSNH
jgi:hypothetical protein